MSGPPCTAGLLASALWCAFVATCPAAHADTAPVAPSAAPDFALKGVDGRNLRLSEYRGEPVVVSFWASYCGPCRESLAALNTLPQSVIPVLGVNLDGTADRAQAVADSLHLAFPTLVDTHQGVARAYDVQKLPLTLLLDRSGVVRAKWSGVPVDLADLNHQLAGLRSE